jgi:hypothetical protein
VPDASFLKALPIGLLLFLLMYLSARRKLSGFRLAAEELPRLAERLGLTFRRGSTDGRAIGKLSGDYRGYSVFVDPDERARVVLTCRAPIQVDLRSYERRFRPPKGFIPFRSGSALVDEFFVCRYATEEIAESIMARAPELERAMRPFQKARSDGLKDLTVTSEGIECVFDFGKPVHLPASVVERTLTDLAVLAGVLEAAAGVEQRPERPEAVER